MIMEQRRNKMICDRCGTEYDDEECPDCKADAQPFKLKHLKSADNEPRLLLTLRLNAEERAQLDEIKEILDITSDGSALKICCFKGWDVLHRTLGKDYLRWLSDKNRLSRGLKK